jgi:hypothetical protein
MVKYLQAFMEKLLKFAPALALILTLAALVPLVAFADHCGGERGLGGILCRLNEVLGAILPFLVALGIIFFVWGVVQYVIGDSDEAKKKGRDRIIYGLIGLAVIISIWGLVFVLVDTLGLGGARAPDVSTLITTPQSSSACPLGSKFQGLLDYITCIIGRSVIPFMFALAVVLFVWGAVKFLLLGADDAESKAKGRQFMIWGIIALTVMLSIWGLVKVLGDTFNLPTTFLPQVKP